MSEGIRVFPERLNPDGEEFISAIEALSRPPERELSHEDRFEVTAFEHALAQGEVPFGVLSPENIRKPEKSMREIYDMTIREEKYCVDYFVQPEVYAENFPEAQDIPLEQRPSYVRAEMARRITDPERRPKLEALSESKLFAREILEDNLRQLDQTGSYDSESDPSYERGLRDPELFLEKAEALREMRGYYRDVQKQVGSIGGKNAELKKELMTMHVERVNILTAAVYREALSLIRQDREGHILTEEQKERMKVALPALRRRTDREESVEAGFVDRENFARFLDRLDKFLNGIDREGDKGHIPDVLRRLQETYEFQVGETRPDYAYADVDPEILAKRKVSAEELQTMSDLVLAEYGLLSSHAEYDSESDDPAPDGKWRSVIDPKTSRKTLGIVGKKRCVMIPQAFKRTLGQSRPAGALPVLDHEIAHVLQNHNAELLGLELFSTLGAARSSGWLEAGGVAMETASLDALFGKDRRVNFTYLAALEKRLEGGSIVECAHEFLKVRRLDDPDGDYNKAVTAAIGGTLRLYNSGGELTHGTPYVARSGALEYAEQKVLADALPAEQRWMLYIGKSSLQSIATLYRLGWIAKEKLLIPERLPSEIVEPYVRTNILSETRQEA